MMILRGHLRHFAAVSGVLLTTVAIALLILWLWRNAAEIDGQPPRSGLNVQSMHRKSRAMHDILDGMIQGDLRRVKTAADQMAAHGNTIEVYLSTAEYQKHAKSFRGAVNDLGTAAREKEMDSAKEATLRLERSCLECHVLMHQRAR